MGRRMVKAFCLLVWSCLVFHDVRGFSVPPGLLGRVSRRRLNTAQTYGVFFSDISAPFHVTHKERSSVSSPAEADSEMPGNILPQLMKTKRKRTRGIMGLDNIEFTTSVLDDYLANQRHVRPGVRRLSTEMSLPQLRAMLLQDILRRRDAE